MNLILYSTHCPKCEVIEKKLKEKELKFTVCDNVETMIEMGLDVMPVLSVDDELLDFAQANKWINSVRE